MDRYFARYQISRATLPVRYGYLVCINNAACSIINIIKTLTYSVYWYIMPEWEKQICINITMVKEYFRKQDLVRTFLKNLIPKNGVTD